VADGQMMDCCCCRAEYEQAYWAYQMEWVECTWEEVSWHWMYRIHLVEEPAQAHDHAPCIHLDPQPHPHHSVSSVSESFPVHPQRTPPPPFLIPHIDERIFCIHPRGHSTRDKRTFANHPWQHANHDHANGNDETSRDHEIDYTHNGRRHIFLLHLSCVWVFVLVPINSRRSSVACTD